MARYFSLFAVFDLGHPEYIAISRYERSIEKFKSIEQYEQWLENHVAKSEWQFWRLYQLEQTNAYTGEGDK